MFASYSFEESVQIFYSTVLLRKVNQFMILPKILITSNYVKVKHFQLLVKIVKVIYREFGNIIVPIPLHQYPPLEIAAKELENCQSNIISLLS